MIWNYLTVGLRKMRRHMFFSLLNILGLAVGIACALLAALYVDYQFQFDRHHEKRDDIYRVIRKLEDASGTRYDPGTKPVASHLRGAFPEIEQVTQMLVREMWVHREDMGFDAAVCVADEHIFDVFTLPMVAGDPKTGLSEPNTAFLSQTLARKFFGDEDPIGKTVSVHFKWFEGDFTITGILKDQPETSTLTLQFDFLTTTYPPHTWRYSVWENWPSNWFLGPLRTYVLVHPGADVSVLAQKLHAFAADHQLPGAAERYDFHLQPLNRIHLYSKLDYGITEANQGDITHCYILLGIGLLVLLIACVNYVNLVTAHSTSRLREIGLRKVVGATRPQLMCQFLAESMLVTMFSLALALAFAEVALPFFNAILGTDLAFTDAGARLALLFPLFALLSVGLLGGSYPALVLSAFKPVQALKGIRGSGVSRTWLRRVMVVLQFSVSVIMIISTLVVYQQIEYVRSKDLGFEKEQVVILPFFLKTRDILPQVGAILNELHAQPGVMKASAFHLPPGQIALDARTVRAEGHGDAEFKLYWNGIDDGYLDLFGLSLIAGKSLAGVPPDVRKIGENQWETFVLINETAARMLGWNDPVGKSFFLPVLGGQGRVQMHVAGVVKDYHNQSLHHGIAPMMLQNFAVPNRVAVKLAPGDKRAQLAGLERVWKQFLPMRPFEYQFLDEVFDAYYRSEMILRKVYGTFAALSIFIGCLGMLGLIALAAQQRTKEIGIRKVLGASVGQIVLLLTRDFLILTAVANLIGWPVAYYLTSSWLDNFIYRIELGPMAFIAAGALTLGIVLVTVGGRAWYAARSNPVDALRYE